MSDQAVLARQRKVFHASLLESILTLNASDVPSNSDKHNKASVSIARELYRQIDVGAGRVAERLSGQTSGHKFEAICQQFLESTFLHLDHLRPGRWAVKQVTGRTHSAIAENEQYAHLEYLALAAKQDKILAASLGNDYSISPDVVIQRLPEPDDVINSADNRIVDRTVANHSTLREVVTKLPTLHASVSCKWTIRSDRAQNARSEALNLIRNRKGRSPHIVLVTAEPTPSRLSSLALGTGDIDCVYHMALPELRAAVASINQSEAEDLLAIMIEGNRLKDISDLPLDLAI